MGLVLSVTKFTTNLYCNCLSILQIYTIQYRFAVSFETLSRETLAQMCDPIKIFADRAVRVGHFLPHFL